MSHGHRFYVKAEKDEESGVWFVSGSDVPGLNAEAETPEELMEILTDLIPELLVANGVLEESDVPAKVPYSLMLDSLQAGRAA